MLKPSHYKVPDESLKIATKRTKNLEDKIMLFRIDVKSKTTGEEKSTILKVENGQNSDLAIEECIDGFIKEMGHLYWRVIKLEG